MGFQPNGRVLGSVIRGAGVVCCYWLYRVDLFSPVERDMPRPVVQVAREPRRHLMTKGGCEVTHVSTRGRGQTTHHPAKSLKGLTSLVISY